MASFLCRVPGSRKSTHRRGVLLLIVMACILIAGLAMVAISRQSLRMATDSIHAEQELQRRWGVASMQRTLLKAAPKILDDLEKQSRIAGSTGPHPSVVSTEVLLGGVKFDALIADEQAKLNLNLAYHLRGESHVRQMAERLKGGGELRLRVTAEVPSAGLASRTRPSDEDDEDEDSPPPPPAFRNWGQVFDLTHAHSTSTQSSSFGRGGTWQLPTATQKLTCWGRGEVNLARASDEVVVETCRPLLGPGVARRLVNEYREYPDRSLQQTALKLKMDERDTLQLGQLVTTRSSTFSLWLNVSSPGGNQQWFAVTSRKDEDGLSTDRFRLR